MADSSIPYPYLDPTQQPAWLDATRKQQMAQMLMGAFQQSNQTPQEWNSMRVVPKRGVLGNVANLATALLAGKAQNSAMDAQQGYMQGMMGGSQPAQPTGPGAGIIDPNAPQGAQDAAQAVTDQPPRSGNVQQPNPMIPAGMPRSTANALISMLGPQEYAKSIVAPQFTPLEINRKLDAAGVTDPRARQEYFAQNLNKENYIAPSDVRPGGTLFDPMSRLPIFSAPANGVQTLWNNGQPAQSVVPGAAPAAQEIAQAEATGKTLGGVVQVPQQGGGTVPQLGANYFKTQPAASPAPVGPAPPRAPTPGGTATGNPAPSAYWSGLPVYKPPSGAGAQSTESAKTSELLPQIRAEQYKKFGTVAQDAAEQERNDLMALRQLGNATVGGDADKLNAGKSVLYTFGLLPEKQAEGLTSSTELGKYLNNNALANARQKFGGGRLTNTDVSLSIEKLNPGTNMTDKAIYNLTVENMIRSAYAKQMADDFTHADKNLGADPQSFEQWYSRQHSLNDFADKNGKTIAQQALGEWKGGVGAMTNPAPVHAPADLEAEMRRRGLIK